MACVNYTLVILMQALYVSYVPFVSKLQWGFIKSHSVKNPSFNWHIHVCTNVNFIFKYLGLLLKSLPGTEVGLNLGPEIHTLQGYKLSGSFEWLFSSPEDNVLKVSFCDGLLSVIRACVHLSVCLSTISLNNFFSKTTWPNLLKLYQNC